MTAPAKPKLKVVAGGIGDMLLRLMKLHVRAAHLSDEEIAECEAITDILMRRGDLKLIKGGVDRPTPDSIERGE